MSTSAPPSSLKGPPGPVAPPEEQFWEKFSPHYEFPLSSVGSVAMHIGALLVFLGALWLLARMTTSDRPSVKMSVVSVMGDGDAAEGSGSGGGSPQENVNPFEVPTNPNRKIPDKDLDPITKDNLKDFLPKVDSTTDAPRVEDLKLPQQLDKLNDELRKKLLDGMNGKKGKGPGDGTGASGVPGAGSGTSGDPTASANRGVRWELIFKTENGRDYVNQLAAMEAMLVIPQPADWKTHKAYKNLGQGRATVEAFNVDSMPGLYFIDDSPESAGKVAQALGLDFSPPMFIAFFPKHIEDELAKQERNHRGRKEGEIFKTVFKILIVDGKPAIRVTDQTAVRR
jgi:hypothetical protein